jgi:hypothetical protein
MVNSREDASENPDREKLLLKWNFTISAFQDFGAIYLEFVNGVAREGN